MTDRTAEIDEQIEACLEDEEPRLAQAFHALMEGNIEDWEAFSLLASQFNDERVRACAMLAAIEGSHASGRMNADHETRLHATRVLVRRALSGTAYEEQIDIALLRHLRDKSDARAASLAGEMLDRWTGYGYFCACVMYAECLVDRGDIEGAIELLVGSMSADQDAALTMCGLKETRIDLRLEGHGAGLAEVEVFREWLRSFAWDRSVR